MIQAPALDHFVQHSLLLGAGFGSQIGKQLFVFTQCEQPFSEALRASPEYRKALRRDSNPSICCFCRTYGGWSMVEAVPVTVGISVESAVMAETITDGCRDHG
jgi:hypothetical protein